MISSSSSATIRALLDRRVHIVAGKGGVGRTTVAAALALRASRAGHRTLLLEVDAPDNATRALGVAPAVDEPREVENNLWACRMTPPGALKEYALLVLRFKLLYRLVFENNLVKYLLRSIPSLAEVTMLGKAWWHATQDRRPDGKLRFDRVIIDAPATGHAITFLGVARVVADVAPSGIMKDQAEEMAKMVEQAVMHVVALPEEMPVNEGLELFDAVPEKLRIGKGLAIINRRTLPLFEGPQHPSLSELEAEPSSRPYARAARLRAQRLALEAEHAGRFIEDSGRPSLVLFERSGASTARIEAVAHAFDRAAETPRRGPDGTELDPAAASAEVGV